MLNKLKTKERFNISLDKTLVQKIKDLTKQNHLNFSSQINQLCWRYFEEAKK